MSVTVLDLFGRRDEARDANMKVGLSHVWRGCEWRVGVEFKFGAKLNDVGGSFIQSHGSFPAAATYP